MELMQIGWRRRRSAPRYLAPGRRTAVEHLDRPDVPPAEKDLSYRDLETVLRLPGQFRPLRDAVLRMAERRRGEEPLRLLELGAGTGLAGLRIAAAIARSGRRVRLTTTDIAPGRLPAPREDGPFAVLPRRLDALRDPLPAADIIFANLLLHHFATEDARDLLARMHQAAAIGGAVFDLDRNAWAFNFMRLFFPLWARTPVSCADALISVQQAFRQGELLALAGSAGIPEPRLRRYLGIRTLLWWER